MIVHQSASLSVNEDVRINFKQSNQCINALKCPKIIKKFDENCGAPPPPCLERAAAADNLSKLVFLDQNVDLRESERPNVILHRVDLIGSIENVRSSGPGVSIEIFVSIVERATLKARFDDGLLT